MHLWTVPFRTRVCLLTLLVIIVLMNSVSAYGAASESVPLLEEIDLPADLNFTVNGDCSGHAYFMQASASENGSFVVYSRHVDPENYTSVDYGKAYIDIYDPNGFFLQELSFDTPLDLAVMLTENTVNIYFYSTALVYDLTTQEIRHYAIPNGAAADGDLYSRLRSKRFVSGVWEYCCEKGYGGYVELHRQAGNQVQVLVEMPGTVSFAKNVTLPGAIIGVATVVVFLTLRFKKRAITPYN